MVVLCGSSKCQFSDRDDNSCRFVSCVCFIFWPQRTAAELVREMAACASLRMWQPLKVGVRGSTRAPPLVLIVLGPWEGTTDSASNSPACYYTALSPAFWNFKKLDWDSRVWIPQGSWGLRAIPAKPSDSCSSGHSKEKATGDVWWVFNKNNEKLKHPALYCLE